MSSYIIAGSSDNADMAYCEEVARKIKAKYTNIDFRIIIKHPTEWDRHIQEVCRIYGFRNKSNPIIYTFDGKIIGDKNAFIRQTSKYFGISEKQMNIGRLSVQVNKKQADTELKAKHKSAKNEKNMLETIDGRLQQLIKNKTFTPKMHNYDKTICNGLVVYSREVENLIPMIKFQVNKQLEPTKEEIIAADLDLMALSIKDQIPVEEVPAKDKEAFVTNQEEAELRRQKTNGSGMRMMESNSHQNQSRHSSTVLKQNKTINNKTQVEEELFEQSPYYQLNNIEKYVVTDLGDEFYLVFNKNPIIIGEMNIIKSAPTEQGNFEMNYQMHQREQRGHLYRPVEFTTPKLETENIVQAQVLVESVEAMEVDDEEDEQLNLANQKSIKAQQEQVLNNEEIQNPQDDLQIQYQSNVYSKVLHFLKPLSNLELSKIYAILNQISGIATLQYKPINPCPQIKIYLRKSLRQATQHSNTVDNPLASEANILDRLENAEPVIQQDNIFLIRQLGYLHLVAPFINLDRTQLTIKKMITRLSLVENIIKKNMGYNIILTTKFILVVALLEPYTIYNNHQLFLDGLSYLGIAHTARTVSGFEVKKQSKQGISEQLLQCAGRISLLFNE